MLFGHHHAVCEFVQVREMQNRDPIVYEARPLKHVTASLNYCALLKITFHRAQKNAEKIRIESNRIIRLRQSRIEL